MVADHLSRLENEEKLDEFIPIRDSFQDEQLFQVSASTFPWFIDYINFLIGQVLPLDFSS